MNWLSWLVPKNSLMAAVTGRMLIRLCGVIDSGSWGPLPDHTLESGQPDPDLVLDQLADGAHPAVAEVVDVVGLHRYLGPVGGLEGRGPGVEMDQVADGVEDVVVAEEPTPAERCSESSGRPNF